MSMTNSSTEPPARRKRLVISCRECHRRKQKCDRRQPCGRCIRRGKKDECLYELDDASMLSGFFPIEPSQQATNDTLQTYPGTTSTAPSVAEDEFKLLGYANNTKGTPGVIKGLGEFTSLPQNLPFHSEPTASQYASIIRELPPRRHMDLLVQAFFTNVAWQYDIVDEALFRSQLSQWNCLTHSQLKQAPASLPTSLQSFPALLFQVLAQALLFQPVKYDESLDDLKYVADMELSDRAADYSDAGHQFASSFSKSELTLTIVQAGLMRACFQKTTGAVIQAWHTLGVAIRDAQELGLHLTEPELKPSLSSETPSDRDLGRKVWFLLHLWDAHMAIVLGRPMSTRMNAGDVPLPMSWSYNSGAPRSPQPRDVILCGYHTAYRFLQDIYDLENVGDCRPIVEDIHNAISTNIANLPAWATTQRSGRDEPPWLAAALETMVTEIHFVLFALHRPFIFAESSSRGKALHSAMQILESQARLFDQTEPLQYKSFSLVLATFDAMVLVAAIHIRFSNEFVEQRPAAKKSLEWGLNRLNVLQARNDLASSAFNVVQRLYQRLLSTTSPVEPLRSLHGLGDNGGFTEEDAEMSQADWCSIMQPNLGDALPPRPLNDLLCDWSLGDPAEQSGSFDELFPLQLEFLDGR